MCENQREKRESVCQRKNRKKKSSKHKINKKINKEKKIEERETTPLSAIVCQHCFSHFQPFSTTLEV